MKKNKKKLACFIVSGKLPDGIFLTPIKIWSRGKKLKKAGVWNFTIQVSDKVIKKLKKPKSSLKLK